MSNSVQSEYQLIVPEQFNVEQQNFIEKVKETIRVISSQTDIILGAKDIHSRHFISTDAYARSGELPGGEELPDRPAADDLPSEHAVRFAHCYAGEELELLQQRDLNKKISVLNIHQNVDGMHALVIDKQLLKHHPSESILGTIYSAREIELARFFSFIPNYVLEFGVNCTIQSCRETYIADNVRLSEYEQEVCYLLTLNWSCRQIADFLNKHRPKPNPRGVDTIYKCRNRICDKLGLSDYSPVNLRALLVGMGMHKKMPQSFFNQISGSGLTGKQPTQNRLGA